MLCLVTRFATLLRLFLFFFLSAAVNGGIKVKAVSILDASIVGPPFLTAWGKAGHDTGSIIRLLKTFTPPT